MHQLSSQINSLTFSANRLPRRQFLLLSSGLATGALVGFGQNAATAQSPTSPLTAPSHVPIPETDLRTDRAVRIRLQCAERLQQSPLVTHPNNGDETLYPNFVGNFAKGLPHNDLGEVEPAAYRALMEAMAGQRSCESIPVAGTLPLANPQAAFAFHLEGMESHNLTLPPAPSFASAEIAAEMVELYWQALTRDVPFSQYGQEPLSQAALADLQRFPSYRQVDRATLFRGETPGDWTGPYLSQFLVQPIPYGSLTINQRYPMPVVGDDHLTAFDEWLTIQNGTPASKVSRFDAQSRYLRTARDLGAYVHSDFTHQAYLNAALILNRLGKAALSPTNPYRQSHNQGGFVTFGAADVLSLVTGIACSALKAAWAQKWIFHRQQRPEEFAARIHQHLLGKANYPIHSSLFESKAVERIYNRFGSYLLPIAYPEGCPAHPCHATIAGACVTVLKAFYNEAYVLPNPLTPAEDGLSLQAYTGDEELSIGGELNKLAANIALGRDAAGVHWRSDSIQGLLLGEAFAISVLADLALTYHEAFDGFIITRFDGKRVMIHA